MVADLEDVLNREEKPNIKNKKISMINVDVGDQGLTPDVKATPRNLHVLQRGPPTMGLSRAD
jgi:hypothetical protein